MDFTPTICIARLLVALQVLMTLLVMPLSSVMMTTSALPVTSKPIESTAENLAWQAWIMLPPEQKQLIKSRKVTPKSIFTLPHRVQCPEGHQQVDMKCIPTVVGSNAVLIDVLGLVLGDAPTADVEYDYEDEPVMGDASNAGNMPFNPPLYLTAGNDGKSHTETVLELKPPSQDEPLKFNIFQSKFPTDDYPMEDYSGISNEGGSAQAPTPVVMEEEKQLVVNTSQTLNVTNSQDLTGEASNVSKTHTLSHLPAGGEFNLASLEAISVPASGQGHDQNRHTISLFNEDSAIHLVTTMMDTEEEEENRKEGDKEKSNFHDLDSLLQTESLMPMLNHTTASTIMALDTLPLLQSNSSQPMELENPVVQIENVDEMTTILPDLMSSGHTTLADDDVEQQTKAEFIRSVTMNPLYDEYVNEEGVVEEEQDDEFTTTLTPSSSNDIEMWQKMKEREDEADDDNAVETTTIDPLTTIQLDDTTIIEGNIEITTIIPQEQEAVESSLTRAKTTTTTTTRINEETITPTSSTTTPASDKKQLIQDFEELQKDQQRNVKQKSKVEPVEVLATRTTASPATTTTASSAASTSGAMASQHETTTTTDELITSGETVTPLLTVHNNGNDNIDNNKNNNNDNNNDVNKANNKNSTSNDRFYYQHFAKQDLESAALKSDVAKETPTTTVTTTAPTTLPSTTAVTSASAEVSAKAPAATSEIDLAEELRLINELVKGKRPGITLTAAEATTLKTTTTTTRKTTKTTTTSQNDDVDNEIHTSPKPMAPAAASTSPVPAPSESSASSAMKYSLETTKIWSKIMPLIKTTTTTTTTEKSPEVSGNSKTSETSLGNFEENEESSAVAPSTSSGQTETTATTTTTPNAASLVVSNRSHRNSKIIRINGLNSLDYKQGKKATTTTTANEDISSTTSTEANPEETSTRESKSSGENDDENIETHDDDDEVADDSAYGSFWWLPISWRLDGSSNKESSSSSSSTTTTSTTAKPQETSSQQQQQEDMPLLLRFWSTYHAPKSS
ncbi:protein folded gastrulation [Musca domestica]|uniref:Protein folded gastrulation n=1 Tax=Musca domestica TaxID=7370 RepID=A0A1I8M7N7_MUSDO|nr:protein folded gastrulation [Musca domestica]XP_058978014.1 protein folded gastrulation [Musca domestica]